MNDVQLVRLDPSIEAALADNPEYMQAMIADDWPRVAELVHDLVGRTLTAIPTSVDLLEWDGYFVVKAATREVVGSCGFKGQPSEDGTVEIAYFTYPEFEGNGYATSMARKLIGLATDCAAVKRVLAQTLPNTNASTRVLEKCGMAFVAEVVDPDDGRVWQWEMPVEA